MEGEVRRRQASSITDSTCACVRACVRACVHAYVRVCSCMKMYLSMNYCRIGMIGTGAYVQN